VGELIVPPAVVEELKAGQEMGVELPEINDFPWIIVRPPESQKVIPLISYLGAGEASVLALALEIEDSIVILDDNLARQTAQSLHIPRTGTLGLLIDAKRAGIIKEVGPVLDQLEKLRFRITIPTRQIVLNLAGEP